MKTVDKALRILDLFDQKSPQIGLSEVARRAGIDKATAHRMLTSLTGYGLLEQVGPHRLYRLGGEILRLAQLREAAFPVTAILKPLLERLAEETGETAHASMMGGSGLVTVGVVESPRSNRVFIEPGLRLPYHATASGLAFLAFAGKELQDSVLTSSLQSITGKTETDPGELRRRIRAVARLGHSMADQTFEEDVFGIAAPIFDANAHAMGAIAVATPAHRMTEKLRTAIVHAVLRAAVEASQLMGGEAPESYSGRGLEAAE